MLSVSSPSLHPSTAPSIKQSVFTGYWATEGCESIIYGEVVALFRVCKEEHFLNSLNPEVLTNSWDSVQLFVCKIWQKHSRQWLISPRNRPPVTPRDLKWTWMAKAGNVSEVFVFSLMQCAIRLLSNDLNGCTFALQEGCVPFCSAGLSITPPSDYLLTQRTKAALCFIIAL